MVVGSHQGVPGSSPGARTTNPTDALFKLARKRPHTGKKNVYGANVTLIPYLFGICDMWAGS